jgi:hypothetical protein
MSLTGGLNILKPVELADRPRAVAASSDRMPDDLRDFVARLYLLIVVFISLIPF